MSISLTIPVELVAQIIQLARQFEVKVAPAVSNPGPNPVDNDDVGVLEAVRSDSTYDRLVEVIDGLNEDEALDLVALMWVGRGTYRAEQWDEARQTARDEATHTTSDYLLGTPLLPDYLAEGLAELGHGGEELEF